MVTERRFAAFQKGVDAPRMGEIPEGGLCLSTFLVISKPGASNRVLMGRLNKDAAWDHIGALDTARAERHSKGWMLPSSHLLLGESPEDASKRILREQLGLDQQPLEGPMVFSEVYGVDRTGENAHWDIEFIYLGERAEVPKCGVWKELTFLDLATAKRDVIARGHEDILSHAGRNVRA